jgi:predicted transcriptional regulator
MSEQPTSQSNAQPPALPRRERGKGRSFYLSQGTIAALRMIASAEDRTMSWIVERAVREYVERQDARTPPVIARG